MPYLRGEVDVLVTWAEGEWFMFDDVHKLPGIVEIQPAKPADHCKWNSAKSRWDRLGLPAVAPAPPVEAVLEPIAPAQAADG